MSFFCVHKQCEIQCTYCIYVDISVYRQLMTVYLITKIILCFINQIVSHFLFIYSELNLGCKFIKLWFPVWMIYLCLLSRPARGPESTRGRGTYSHGNYEWTQNRPDVVRMNQGVKMLSKKKRYFLFRVELLRLDRSGIEVRV